MTPTVARTLRPVYCVIEHLHRDLDVALHACEGRFRIAGARLCAGPVPDWRAVDLDRDLERWIEWSKFYYGLDMAFAFAHTGDAKFLRTWERFVMSWIAQVPADFGPTDALGRRLQNWIYAANIFAAAPTFSGFAPGFDDLLARQLAEHADYLQGHLTPERNHRTLELYALFIAALALPASDREAERLSVAWRALQENLLSDFRPDGVHREHSTHYHMIVLRSFIGARENARRAGLDIPAAYDAALQRAIDFAMYCHRPDGTMPALSDGDIGRYEEVLETAAQALERPDVLYVATGGRAGSPPPHACADFPEAGYFVQRSAFDEMRDDCGNHRHLVFDCGHIGDGGHGHYDSLSIDVWCGRHLLVDPGRYTYDPSDEWRRWFKGTAAHNTVCVDGRDQTAYRPGKPKAGAISRLSTRYSAPQLEVVGGEVISAQYDAIHRRQVFFVASEYWIVIDDLQGETPHEYDLRFHLAPDAEGSTQMQGSQVTAPGVRLLFDGPGTCTLESGWMAPEYGVKRSAPVVSRRARPATSARFITAIVPLGPGNAAVEHRLSAAPADAATEWLVLEGAGARGEFVDRLAWASDASGARRAALERRSR